MDETRLVKITEINLEENYIAGIDNFKQKMMIATFLKEPYTVVPQKDET
jgi:hypothetical protein